MSQGFRLTRIKAEVMITVIDYLKYNGLTHAQSLVQSHAQHTPCTIKERSYTKTLALTHYQAESVTEGCLCPSQAVVWQVDVLCCAVDVASTHPGS